MTHCVNIKHKDFQRLMEETGLDSLALSAKMGVWMKNNNTDEWPSLKELGLQSISDTFNENGTTSPENIESGTESLKMSPTAKSVVTINQNENLGNRFLTNKEITALRRKYFSGPRGYYLSNLETRSDSNNNPMYRVMFVEKGEIAIDPFTEVQIMNVKSDPEFISNLFTKYREDVRASEELKKYSVKPLSIKSFSIKEFEKLSNKEKDLIEKDDHTVNGNKLTNAVLKLYNKLGLTYRFFSDIDDISISSLIDAASKARDMARDKILGFVHESIVYLKTGAVTEHIQLEEGLHSFVNSLYVTNEPLFNKLLDEARKDFPVLAKEISSSYTKELKFTDNDRDQELVTQALARYVSREFQNKGQQTIAFDALKQIAKDIISTNENLFTVDVNSLDNLTMTDLANVINSTNVSFKGIIKDSKPRFHKTSGATIKKLQNTSEYIEAAKQKIIEGLTNRINTLKKHSLGNQNYILSLDAYVNKLNALDNFDAIISFIQNINTEAVRNYNLLNDALDKGADLDTDFIYTITTNFIDFYKGQRNEIAVLIEANKNNTEFKMYLKAANMTFNDLEGLLDESAKKLASIEEWINLANEQATNEILNGVIASAGYTNTDVLLESIKGNNDIWGITRMCSHMSNMRDPVLSAVNLALSKLNSKIHRLQYEDTVKLIDTFKKIVGKRPPVNLAHIIYEKDANGGFTQYVISSLRRGEYEINKRKFYAELRAKYNLENDGSRPIDPIKRKEYNEEVIQWRIENETMKFHPDFYRAYMDLSDDTMNEIKSIDIQINEILDDYTEDGVFESNKVTAKDWAKYEALLKYKKNLSNKYDHEGNLKYGKALQIAIELSEFNEKRNKFLNYTKNKKKFDEAEEKIVKKYGAGSTEHLTWLNRNQKQTISSDFYDILQSISTKHLQDQAYLDLDERLKSTLKHYKNNITGEVEGSQIPEKVREELLQIEKEMSALRVKNATKQKLSFFDIAESVGTSDYYSIINDFNIRLANAEKQYGISSKEYIKINEEYDEWYDKSHILGSNNKYQIASFYRKVRPINEATREERAKGIYKSKYVTTEPSDLFVEYDENSPYINKDYISEVETYKEDIYGDIPLRSKYDNRKAFDKVQSNNMHSKLRDEVLKHIAESNHLLGAKKRRKHSLMLPGLTGTIGDKFRKRGNLFKKLWYSTKDYVFSSTSDEREKTTMKSTFSSSGERIKEVNTNMLSMIDSPEQISTDVMFLLKAYRDMAINKNIKDQHKSEYEVIRRQIYMSSVYDKRSIHSLWKRGTNFIKNKITNANEERIVEKSLDMGTSNRYRALVKMYDRDLYSVSQDLSNSGRVYNKIINELLSNKLFAGPALALNTSVIIQSFLETAGKNMIKELSVAHSMSASEVLAVEKAILEYGKDTILGKHNKMASLIHYFDMIDSKENVKGSNKWRITNFLKNDVMKAGYHQLEWHNASLALMTTMSRFRLFEDKFISLPDFERLMNQRSGMSQDEAISEFKKLDTTLFEAFDLDSLGLPIVKDEYKDIIDEDTIDKAGVRSAYMLQRLNGTIHKNFRIALQDDIYFKFLTMLRGWFFFGFSERFKPRHFNMIMGREEVGYQRNPVKFLYQMLTSLQNSVRKLARMSQKVNVMDRVEMEGFNKISIELAMLAAGTISSILLMNKAEDDDDDSYLRWKLIETVNRFNLELSAWYNPGTIPAMINSPAAQVSVIETMLKIPTDVLILGDQPVERGIWKNVGPTLGLDETPKFIRGVGRMLPGKAFIEGLDPKARVNYQMNQLNKNNYLKDMYDKIFTDKYENGGGSYTPRRRRKRKEEDDFFDSNSFDQNNDWNENTDSPDFSE